MLSKNEIKDIQSLGLKKTRQEKGTFVAEGPKIVSELAEAFPESVQRMYHLQTWSLPKGIDSSKAVVVSEVELSKISQLQTPNQVLAVLRQFPSVQPPPQAPALYLDTVQDPGNLGTIIRIADWFGINHVVCSRLCADLYNSKTVQSTMASIGRVNVFVDEAENWLMQQDRAIFAATLHGSPLNNDLQLKNGILLIGNESKGIRPEFISLASQQVTIPRIGQAESLNAAVATGILLSHLCR